MCDDNRIQIRAKCFRRFQKQSHESLCPKLTLSYHFEDRWKFNYPYQFVSELWLDLIMQVRDV